MDENTKEIARQYLASMKESIVVPDKLPVRLGAPEQTAAALLGTYGAMVEGRGLPFHMDDATVSKVDRVVRWIHESPKRGLLLCGTLGNGKTTMLRALKSMLGTHAVYAEAQYIYDCFRSSQHLPEIPRNEVLLIDDLGVEPPTYNDFGEIRYPLTEMLLARYRMNATTVIATNYTFEQLAETYGDRVGDRMKEMFAMIKYVEPSYRDK